MSCNLHYLDLIWKYKNVFPHSKLWQIEEWSENLSFFRYVGENYSNAQEAMEDAMQTFYSQNSIQHPVSNPIVGQLVAVRGEDGAEMARGQVLEVTGPNKVKVNFLNLFIFNHSSVLVCLWVLKVLNVYI